MSQKIRAERPSQVIKSNLTPLSGDLKAKLSSAIQTVVTKIKEKHMS